MFDCDVLAVDVAGFLQTLAERGFILVIVTSQPGGEVPDHWNRRLLRSRRKRPRRRAADKRDELAPPHSITSSASASSVGGISTPNAFAVARLMTSSNLVPSSTGRSPGFSPLRIRPT